jgi:hypothetical protein
MVFVTLVTLRSVKVQSTLFLYAVTVLMIGAAVNAAGQSTSESEGARRLYYLSVRPKDTLAPLSTGTGTGSPASSPAGKPSGAVHLGFRYNVVLVDPSSGKSTAVDSNRNFHSGECFAIEVESNRSGYLYVLAKQSSGGWRPLLPTAEMSGETNVLDPGKKLRTPQQYCYEIHDPPGSETLFVVLSREPRDFYDLYEGIKGKSNTPFVKPDIAPRPAENLPEMADARRVNTAVAQMANKFGTRDIAIRKVSKPLASGEAPGSVYVVNASAAPTTSIATQIHVNHR